MDEIVVLAIPLAREKSSTVQSTETQ